MAFIFMFDAYVHQVLLISYGTPKVSANIQERLGCGVFIFEPNFRPSLSGPEITAHPFFDYIPWSTH